MIHSGGNTVTPATPTDNGESGNADLDPLTALLTEIADVLRPLNAGDRAAIVEHVAALPAHLENRRRISTDKQDVEHWLEACPVPLTHPIKTGITAMLRALSPPLES